jgi:hypothetical protein
MTHTRSAVALGAMLMATAASAQVQNGNFATDLSHWEQHGHKRATMGTAANPKIPKNFAELGLTNQDDISNDFVSKSARMAAPFRMS